MACLVIDIGNTSTAMAVWSRGGVRGRARIPTAVADRATVRRAVERCVSRRRIEGAVLCSVVPDRNRVWVESLRRALGVAPLVVSHKLRLGIRISYPRPGRIGADRLANACAAADILGAPAIVADFGTATTFDAINRDGAFIGGVIAPGLPLMSEYLFEKTALLPRVRLTGRIAALGRSTREAMRIGARTGYRGLVREITAHVLRHPAMSDARLCATGGYARLALDGLDLPFEFDPDLTLRGLGRIFELNGRSEG